MTEEIRCEVCSKTFKTVQALRGHMQGDCGSRQAGGSAVVERDTSSRSLAKTGSLDAAIEKLLVPEIPDEFNGAAQIYWAGFNKGVSYGVDTILAGIRAAQELSSLGISQATPIIKMAQEMRQAEGQAAQEIAGQLAQVNVETNQQVLSAINALAASQGKAQPAPTNPMAEMMTELMKPHLQQVMSQVFTGMLAGKPQPAAGHQLQPGQQQQHTQTWQAPNITRKSIGEYEEDGDV